MLDLAAAVCLYSGKEPVSSTVIRLLQACRTGQSAMPARVSSELGGSWKVKMKPILPCLLLSLRLSVPALSDDCSDLVSAFENTAAVGCLEALLATDPGQLDLELRLVRALVDAGEDSEGAIAEAYFQRAMVLARRLAEEHPGSAEGFYYDAAATGRYAQFLGGKQKVALAHHVRESVDHALRVDPHHAEALLTRGIYFYELATLNRALRFFAELLYGDLPEGDLEDARRDLESSLRLAPGNTNTLYHLALVGFVNDDYNACVDYCRRAIAQPLTDHLDSRNQKLAAELERRAAKKLGKPAGRR